MKKLYVVMPAYNEEANIEQVVKDWYPVVEGKSAESRLVIADSGSSDKTHEILENLKKTYNKLEILTDTNRYHGPKVIALYDYAIKQGADFIFQTDSDGQTLPEEFWQFWEKRKKCGLLIGYRKKREDGLSRIFVTRVLRLVLFLIFGTWVKDANTPYRLMRGKQLEKVLKRIPDGFFLSNVLMTVIYEKHHLYVEYIPITFRPRQAGKNSINMKRIAGIGRQALGDFIRLRHRI